MALAEVYVFIDLQGFQGSNNKFIPKEICILTSEIEFHNIIKSPCQYYQLPSACKRSANFLSQSYHGLEFNHGELPLTEFLTRVLPHIERKICVLRGDRKILWLQQIFNGFNNSIQFLNIDSLRLDFEFREEKLHDIRRICPHHEQIASEMICRCSLSQAKQMQQFFAQLFRESFQSERI